MNSDRLAAIKSRLKSLGPFEVTLTCKSDLRDLIAALEAAQGSIATLEAQRDALRDVATAAEYVASDRHAHNFAVYQAKRDIARKIWALA